MKRRTILTMLVVVAALAMAACGEGAGGPTTSIKVTMTDFAFSPNSSTVPTGQHISLEIVNNDATTHTFAIMQAGHVVQGHFTEADRAGIFWAEAPVPPGETVRAAFTAPGQPSEYQIVCDIAGHFEAGMTQPPRREVTVPGTAMLQGKMRG